jgi:hypothetical protein
MGWKEVEKRKAKSEKRDELNVNVLPRSLRYDVALHVKLRINKRRDAPVGMTVGPSESLVVGLREGLTTEGALTRSRSGESGMTAGIGGKTH